MSIVGEYSMGITELLCFLLFFALPSVLLDTTVFMEPPVFQGLPILSDMRFGAIGLIADDAFFIGTTLFFSAFFFFSGMKAAKLKYQSLINLIIIYISQSVNDLEVHQM